MPKREVPLTEQESWDELTFHKVRGMYLYVSSCGCKGGSKKQKQVAEGVILDFDVKGHLMGIEILRSPIRVTVNH
jgi:uncharacterized protein YuzE